MAWKDDARTWARDNLSPAQFESFMRAVGEERVWKFIVAVGGEWTPTEPHLADRQGIERQIEAALRNNMTDGTFAKLNVTVTQRQTY